MEIKTFACTSILSNHGSVSSVAVVGKIGGLVEIVVLDKLSEITVVNKEVRLRAYWALANRSHGSSVAGVCSALDSG